MASPGLPGVSGVGKTRTEMHCHSCKRGFVAIVDYDVDGCHVMVCPRCGHRHFRVISGGKVTEDRWKPAVGTIESEIVPPGSVWSSPEVQGSTSVASLFIRDSWLNFGNKEEGHL